MYHHPMVMYIKAEDPDLPAFYYDPLIHPIAFYKSESRAGAPPAGGPDSVLDEADEEWALPEGLDPFLTEAPLYSETTAAVRSLPFSSHCCVSNLSYISYPFTADAFVI